MVLSLPLLLLPDGVATARTEAIEVRGYAVPLSQLSIVGQRFESGAQLQITWDGSKEHMPKVRAAADGTFERGVRVPAGAEPGTHIITVVPATGAAASRSADRDVLARASIIVLAPRAEQSSDVASPADTMSSLVPDASASPSGELAQTDVPAADGARGPDPATPEPTPTPTSVAAAPDPSTASATAAPAPGGQAPPPPPPASGRRTVFVANAETGDASQWCYVHSAVGVGVVTSPVRAGGFAYRSEVRDGAEIFDTERSEYSNGPGACNKHLNTAGTETWTYFSIFPAADYPSFDHWSLVAQWHEPWGGTPPQQINLENDRWSVVGANSVSPRPRFTFGSLQRGQWQDFVVHHMWSTDPSVGFVEVYLNGQLVLPKTHMRTLENNNPVFFSVGQYRDTDPDTGTAVLFVDEVRVEQVP